jgi:hypothetical protein
VRKWRISARRALAALVVLVLLAYGAVSFARTTGPCSAITAWSSGPRARTPATEPWLVPGCDHVKAFDTQSDEWQRRVLAFLAREIP